MMESSKHSEAETSSQDAAPIDLSRRFVQLSVAFFVLGLVLLEVAYRALVEPAIQNILAGQDATATPYGPLGMVYHLSAVGSFVLLTLAAVVILWFAIVRPARADQARENHLRADVEDAERNRRITQNQLDRSTAQVKATLADNAELRKQLDHLGDEGRIVQRMRDAMLETTSEATLLVDLNSRIVACSQSATVRLHTSHRNLLGRVFDDAVPLYETNVDQPFDHPIRGLVNQALAADASATKMREGQLMAGPEKFDPVFISVQVVHDTGNRPVGAVVRLSDPIESDVGLEFGVTEEIAAPAQGAAPRERDWTHVLGPREKFEQRFDELAALAHESASRHALLLIGVDEFARVMDTRGFWAAEQLLSHSARVIHEALEDGSAAYHLSAGRFAVLLAHTDLDEARELAEAIRDRAARSASAWEGASVGSTFSIAVVEIDKQSAGRSELLTDAEAQLQVALSRNGNLVIHEKPDEDVLARRRDDAGWLDWVQQRIEQDQIHLTSQLVKSVAPEKKPLFEVFLRIEDDDGVWLTPQNYLPALERLQRTAVLDLWVLRQTLEAFGENKKLPDEYLAAMINVSASSLETPDFAFNALELLMKPGVDPASICFEIDERTALTSNETVQKFIETVRPSGARISLDRCQTTTGISHLRDLPVDYIKIHSRLIQRIDHDTLDRKHLEWIHEAAHLAGRQTCAIGVESSETLELLRKIGIDYVQGMAISKFGPLIR